MVSVTTVIRRTPPNLLQAYFAAQNIDLAAVDWEAEQKEIAKTVIVAIRSLDQEHHERVSRDADRVGAMADEAGTVALISVVDASLSESLEALAGGYARAIWMFIEHPDLFQRAEEVRYTDDHRRGRRWDGFMGEAELEVKRDDAALAAFRQSIAEKFGSRNVHVELFDRRRTTLDGKDYSLIQATIYSEGSFEEYLQFVDGGLGLNGRHPVLEACVVYEPQTGVIEVVGPDKAAREDYARLFSGVMLGDDFEDERIPLRRYTLDVLLKHHDFPTDAGDGIESVRVTSLRLMPIETNAERLTIECMRGGKRNICEAAAHHFALANPLHGGWIVTQARLSIRFQPEKGAGRAKVLPMMISAPHGCDLKERTDRERLIGEKYLRRWQLIEEV